jgi:hypothetical protein
VRSATGALVDSGKQRQWDPESIKRCDSSIGKRQAHGPNCFVPPGAYQDLLLAVSHPAARMKTAKKFHVFHQRHFWKAANSEEDISATEYPMITASYSEHNARVMRKAVR